MISEGMLLHRVVEERLLGLLGTCESTSPSRRYGISPEQRKYVLPILEHFDARGTRVVWATTDPSKEKSSAERKINKKRK